MDIRIREYTQASGRRRGSQDNGTILVEGGSSISAAGTSYGRDREPFFSEQSFTGIAYDGGEEKSWDCIFSIPIMWGAAYICNASYAVRNPSCRGTISERHW